MACTPNTRLIAYALGHANTSHTVLVGAWMSAAMLSKREKISYSSLLKRLSDGMIEALCNSSAQEKALSSLNYKAAGTVGPSSVIMGGAQLAGIENNLTLSNVLETMARTLGRAYERHKDPRRNIAEPACYVHVAAALTEVEVLQKDAARDEVPHIDRPKPMRYDKEKVEPLLFELNQQAEVEEIFINNILCTDIIAEAVKAKNDPSNAELEIDPWTH